MAKRKRSRRRRGMGSVIQVKQLSGTERLNNPASMTGALLPVVLGGVATLLTTFGVTQYVEPTPENAPIIDNAGWLGLGAGMLTALALWNVASRPAGIAAGAAAAVLTFGQMLPKWMAASMPASPGTGRGVRAIVPEYSLNGTRGTRGTSAIAMQSQSSRGYGRDAGGENLTLGALNPAAFGTPTFRMGR